MSHRKPARGRRARAEVVSQIPSVYRNMLDEVSDAPSSERPTKRPRTGRKSAKPQALGNDDLRLNGDGQEDDAVDEDEDLEFETVPLADSSASAFDNDSSLPFPRQPSVDQDSDDDEEDGDDDSDFDIFDYGNDKEDERPSGVVGVVSDPRSSSTIKRTLPRKKTISKDDRDTRLTIHKVHILCLLSHALKPLLSRRTVSFLRPRTDLSQFSQGTTLKKGLEEACGEWLEKFQITARGLRRSLWAEDSKDLENYKLEHDADSIYDISDFREAAVRLKGSQDLGAQLFCAMLRSVGVTARLVCSLQPLSFASGEPNMPKSRAIRSPTREAANVDIPSSVSRSGGYLSSSFTNPRSRLGHPYAAAHHPPKIDTPADSSYRAPPSIEKSDFPVYWVEVLDRAYQKWHPVDPFTPSTVSKRAAFAPSASNLKVAFSYVIAFEGSGRARDVTRRYAKAYNSKTFRIRVESTKGGTRWWMRTMRCFARGDETDEEYMASEIADQIENIELATFEGQEPMPKSIIDFKNHPIYAIERHLKRNEVIVNAVRSGRVKIGKGNEMVDVYRRKNVKIARPATTWHRKFGRVIKMGEAPVKSIPAKQQPQDDVSDDENNSRAVDVGLYTEDQTILYEAPPVSNGLVPANQYGNIDLFVGTMVPKGGVYVSHDEAADAARILGIHYANALTGWKFRGRRGTPIVKGVVVAEEYGEAMEAVVAGIRDNLAFEEHQARSEQALHLWARFYKALQIKERVNPDDPEGHQSDSCPAEESQLSGDDKTDGSVYAGGGGFLPD